MGILVAVLLGFFIFEAFGYVIHRLLHTKWMGPLHRAHMTHHLVKYPPTDYLSETYRSAGADNTTLRFIVAGVALAAGLIYLLPLWLCLPLLMELALVGYVNHYIHDNSHIRGHWMERYGFFRRWREIHYQHHLRMETNYGIITFGMDRLVGTYVGEGGARTFCQ
jgi:sterol desaturase/sphingolipid hydroxylase (fatty acid hydroxylase superfamily)